MRSILAGIVGRLILLLALIFSYIGQAQAYTLTASADLATSYAYRSIMIGVLTNDTTDLDTGWANVTVYIVAHPAHGTVTVRSDKKIRYAPYPGFTGQDSFTYGLRSTVGGITKTSQAVVNVTVRGLLTLVWDPHPAEQRAIIIGFRLFMGPDPDNLSMVKDELVLSLIRDPIDLLSPSLTYMPSEDLGLVVGQYVCFRLTVYAAVVESDRSNAACTTIQKI